MQRQKEISDWGFFILSFFNVIGSFANIYHMCVCQEKTVHEYGLVSKQEWRFIRRIIENFSFL